MLLNPVLYGVKYFSNFAIFGSWKSFIQNTWIFIQFWDSADSSLTDPVSCRNDILSDSLHPILDLLLIESSSFLFWIDIQRVTISFLLAQKRAASLDRQRWKSTFEEAPLWPKKCLQKHRSPHILSLSWIHASLSVFVCYWVLRFSSFDNRAVDIVFNKDTLCFLG